MANNLLDDLEFENQINALGDDQPALIKFVARQQFETSKELVSHHKRIKSLEEKNNKVMGIIGGVGALIGAAVTASIEYVIRRGSSG